MESASYTISKYLFLGFLLFFCSKTHGQINGVINSYAKVDNISGNVITISNVSLAGGVTNAGDVFGNGDKVLIIQMKGVSITTGNTATYGDITDYQDAGNYEFATVNTIATITGGYQLTLNGLTRAYSTGGLVQIVNVLQYTDVTVDGEVTALPWDQSVGYGGVVALEVTGALTLDANINVSGQGFVGGTVNFNNNCANATTNITYFTDVSSGYGQKGEGIAEYITSQEYGKGKLGSGGGGGNPHNAGGGGGSNLASGGNGGRGFQGSCNSDGGGLAGAALTYDAVTNKIFMGGGGGGGNHNNNQGSPGGSGGGIIILRANEVTSSCGSTYGFYADGVNAVQAGADGAGGGGAGGTILLEVEVYTPACTIVAHADGGDGGDSVNNEVHAGGGGGGMGAILSKNPISSSMLDFDSSSGGAGVDCASCVASSGTDGGTATPIITGWEIPGDTSPLPVELAYIALEKTIQGIVVEWTTLSERNTDYFVVEKSLDLRSVEEVGQLDALGNSSSARKYKLLDMNPSPGISYYRIRSVDHDLFTQYSNWQAIVWEGSFSALYQIFPNPATQDLQMTLHQTSGSFIRKIILQDYTGRTIQAWEGDTLLFPLTISRENLPAGTYLLKIITPLEVYIEKVLFY